MNPVIKNIVALVAGVLVGSVVNIALVNLGPVLVPLPEGADISSMENLSESMKLFTPVNFLFPFLGHALGTLCGAFIAAKFAARRPLFLAICIGAVFLAGGVMMVVQLSAPMWFNVTDLLMAYFPMAYLGGFLGRGKKWEASR
jgi:hypothetical protein